MAVADLAYGMDQSYSAFRLPGQQAIAGAAAPTTCSRRRRSSRTRGPRSAPPTPSRRPTASASPAGGSRWSTRSAAPRPGSGPTSRRSAWPRRPERVHHEQRAAADRRAWGSAAPWRRPSAIRELWEARSRVSPKTLTRLTSASWMNDVSSSERAAAARVLCCKRASHAPRDRPRDALSVGRRSPRDHDLRRRRPPPGAAAIRCSSSPLAIERGRARDADRAERRARRSGVAAALSAHRRGAGRRRRPARPAGQRAPAPALRSTSRPTSSGRRPSWRPAGTGSSSSRRLAPARRCARRAAR